MTGALVTPPARQAALVDADLHISREIFRPENFSRKKFFGQKFSLAEHIWDL
jgi:hypothetical protein